MNQLQNLKQGYSKETIANMLKALLKEPQRSKLRLVQVDELKVLESSTKKLNETERNYIKTLYQNFVLNKFEFDDKSNKPVIKPLVIKEHVGITMLRELNDAAAMLFYSDKSFKLTE